MTSFSEMTKSKVISKISRAKPKMVSIALKYEATSPGVSPLIRLKKTRKRRKLKLKKRRKMKNGNFLSLSR